MKAIILAGGQGTRLRSVTGNRIPKPMAEVGGRPVLAILLETLKRNGIEDICCTLRTLPEVITGYFGKGEGYGVRLSYRIEDSVLGTAGALLGCRDFVGDEPFLVCSGDALLDCELAPLWELQKSRRATAVLGLWECSAPMAFGLCLTDGGSRIRAFVEKPRWDQVVTNLVNTGIYVFSPRIFSFIPEDTAYDIGRELLPKLLESGELLCGLPLRGYWRDIGEPESYYRANLDVLEGKLPHLPGKAPQSPSLPLRRYRCALHLPSRDAARLMRSLSAMLMEAGADFTDGLNLQGVHIAPCSEKELLLESGDEATAKKYAALCARLEDEALPQAEMK